MCADDPMFPAADLSELELRVLNAVRACPGRGFAIPMETLAEQCGIGTRLLQETISHLVTDHDFPIGSATGKPNGYYWITTPDELAKSKTQIRNRLKADARRLAALEGVTHYEILGQLSLELKQEAIPA